jgi:tetratricopeptide (TPR) repeat protein
VGDRPGEVTALNNLGLLYFRQEAFAEMHGFARHRDDESSAAQNYLEQALAVAHTAGDWSGEWRTFINLAQLAQDVGQWQAAQQYQEQAIEILHDQGDYENEAAILHTAGEQAADRDDKEQARQYFERQLVIEHERGDRFGEGLLLVTIGALTADLGEKNLARPYYDRALAIFEAIGAEGQAAFVRTRIEALWPFPRHGRWPFGRRG